MAPDSLTSLLSKVKSAVTPYSYSSLIHCLENKLLEKDTGRRLQSKGYHIAMSWKWSSPGPGVIQESKSVEKEKSPELGEAGRWLMGLRVRKAQVTKGKRRFLVPSSCVQLRPRNVKDHNTQCSKHSHSSAFKPHHSFAGRETGLSL